MGRVALTHEGVRFEDQGISSGGLVAAVAVTLTLLLSAIVFGDESNAPIDVVPVLAAMWLVPMGLLARWLARGVEAVTVTSRELVVERRVLRVRSRVARYPLREVVVHGVYEDDGAPTLEIAVPDRVLRLHGPRDALERASTLVQRAVQEARRRADEAGTARDVPPGLADLAGRAREPEPR